jgi:hypothetical protein
MVPAQGGTKQGLEKREKLVRHPSSSWRQTEQEDTERKGKRKSTHSEGLAQGDEPQGDVLHSLGGKVEAVGGREWSMSTIRVNGG